MRPVSIHLGTLVSQTLALNEKVLLVLINPRAGGPGLNPEDLKWLDNKLKVLLEDETTLMSQTSISK